MTLVYKDRVQESTSTTGIGAYALGGAVPGYQSFDAAGDGSTCYYSVTDGLNWEVGLGTYSASPLRRLTRTRILASSNGGSAVAWPLGVGKPIWLDFPSLAASYLAGGTTGSGPVVLANGPEIDLSEATGLTAALVQSALASLPTSLPGTSGQLWWNGGVLSLS